MGGGWGVLGETLKQNEMRKTETKLSGRIRGRVWCLKLLEFPKDKDQFADSRVPSAL